MTALSTTTTELGFENFIKEEITLISSLNDARIQQMMDYSKEFLDKVFPLATGSHKNVRSYVVYYQHLLIFMEDGTQTGLQNPSQFVALTGHRENPMSVLLQNEQGRHVEIIFKVDSAQVEDIQVEAQVGDMGEVSIAANDSTEELNWFSMIRGDSKITTDNSGKKICKCAKTRKSFTGKDGGVYRI